MYILTIGYFLPILKNREELEGIKKSPPKQGRILTGGGNFAGFPEYIPLITYQSADLQGNPGDEEGVEVHPAVEGHHLVQLLVALLTRLLIQDCEIKCVSALLPYLIRDCEIKYSSAHPSSNTK